MTRNPSKVVLGFALVLGVWVTVFWVYKPSLPPELTPTAVTASVPPAEVFDPLNQPALPADGGFAPDDEPLAPGTSVAPEPAPVPTVVRTRTQKQLIAPAFTEYTVQRGDTSFEAISRRFYGTTRHGAAISRANPLLSPAKLRVGTVIKIPQDPTNIQGRVADVQVVERVPATNPVRLAPGLPAIGQPVDPQTGQPIDAGSPGPASAPPAVQDVVRHTVRAGETLSDIAKQHYGSASRWKPILDANHSVLSRPERIKPGMVLVIPAP